MSEPSYVVNVDVAVRRDRTAAEPEYLFIRRGTDEDHAPGALGFPGGTLEAPPGEGGVLAAAARREVREEVGVELETVEHVTATTFELDTGGTCLNVVVRADHASGEAHVADPEEVGAVEWRSGRAVVEDPETPPWTRDLVEAVLAADSDAAESGTGRQ